MLVAGGVEIVKVDLVISIRVKNSFAIIPTNYDMLRTTGKNKTRLTRHSGKPKEKIYSRGAYVSLIKKLIESDPIDLSMT